MVQGNECLKAYIGTWQGFSMTVEQEIRLDRLARKNHLFTQAELYYSKVEGVGRHKVVALFRDLLGANYDARVRYYRAIHTWSLSGVEGYRALPIHTLASSQGLDVEIKRELVAYWNEGHTSAEVADWIQAHKPKEARSVEGERVKCQKVLERAIKAYGAEMVTRVLEEALNGQEVGHFDDLDE